VSGCIGWFILLPFAGAWWLTIKVIDACIKKSSALRPLGIILSLAVGGGSIVAGYFIGPIVGWFIMAVGGLVVVIGTWRSLVVTRQQVQLAEIEEFREKLFKGQQLSELEEERWGKMWKSAREEARELVGRGKIDNRERFEFISSILLLHGSDSESYQLYSELKKLERKSTIEEAKKILEQSNINNYQKKDWKTFETIFVRLALYDYSDHETRQLLEQLKELRRQAKK
jgi:hypothetical protein